MDPLQAPPGVVAHTVRPAGHARGAFTTGYLAFPPAARASLAIMKPFVPDSLLELPPQPIILKRREGRGSVRGRGGGARHVGAGENRCGGAQGCGAPGRGVSCAGHRPGGLEGGPHQGEAHLVRARVVERGRNLPPRERHPRRGRRRDRGRGQGQTQGQGQRRRRASGRDRRRVRGGRASLQMNSRCGCWMRPCVT